MPTLPESLLVASHNMDALGLAQALQQYYDQTGVVFGEDPWACALEARVAYYGFFDELEQTTTALEENRPVMSAAVATDQLSRFTDAIDAFVEDATNGEVAIINGLVNTTGQRPFRESRLYNSLLANPDVSRRIMGLIGASNYRGLTTVQLVESAAKSSIYVISKHATLAHETIEDLVAALEIGTADQDDCDEARSEIDHMFERNHEEILRAKDGLLPPPNQEDEHVNS